MMLTNDDGRLGGDSGDSGRMIFERTLSFHDPHPSPH